MRKANIEVMVYKFDELSEKARENAKEIYYPIWERGNFFQDLIDEKLSELGLKDQEIKYQYSLSNCQGDGFNLYGRVKSDFMLYYIQKLNFFTTEEYEKLIVFINDLCVPFIELPVNNRYCYCTSFQIEFAYDWLDQCDWIENENDKKEIERLLLLFEKKVKEVFSDLCSNFETLGYETFDTMSDEEFTQICEELKLEFYYNGEIFSL